MNKIKCDHCHLSYDEDIMIKDYGFVDKKYFCCKGCQGVYHLLNEEGFGSFYERMGKNTITPPKEGEKDLQKFDVEGFRQKYVKQNNGLCEISLIIEGIHCPACVWLNEKVLHRADGVVEASVNGTSHKAKVVWDDDVISLSRIIEIIQSIGYGATPYDPALQEAHANARKREYYGRLLVAVFATMNIMWIAIAQYAGYFTGIRADIKNIFNFAEFVLATPVLFYTGSVYFKGAYYGLKNRHINMDFLVATGASLAYLYSLYAMFSQHGETYFDSVTMIVTFVFAGKYLEVLTQKKAVDTLDSLNGSLPTEVTVIHNYKNENQEKVLVGLENVQIGDVIELKPGEKVVIDGEILSGEASFDYSSITGENIPLAKEKNDEILSGSICLDSVVLYKASKVYQDSMLSKITTLLEDSMVKKPRIEQLANTISGYFSLGILTLSLLTFCGWLYATGDFERALIVGISVIVIACPCALGLATPVSTLVGMGVAVKNGILFKEATGLEAIAKSTHLMLDKTGTITEGKPKVTRMIKLADFDENLMYSLLKTSNHPISLGVLEYLEEQDLKELPLEKVKNIPSKGVEAYSEGKRLLGGNHKFLNEHGLTCKESAGQSEYWFAIDDRVVMGFLLEDLPRKDAQEAIEEIQSFGVEVQMLTGDNESAAKTISDKLGIKKYFASLFPIDKAQKVEEQKGKKKIVVMAGDGINDALALSKSDVAIAIGGGADVALAVSDVVLLDESLKSLAIAFRVGKRTYSSIKQNLSISLLYNLFTIPLAMSGFVTPLVAALSMSLSSLVVVLNSMRIKTYFKENR